jgi:hypothetical protein
MSESKSNSFSFTKLLVVALTLIFVYCKLTGYVNWSWFKVFSPIWVYAAFWIVIALITLIVVARKANRSKNDLQRRLEELQKRYNRR